MPEKPGRGKGGYARAMKRARLGDSLDWRRVRGLALPVSEREFLLESARLVPKGSVIVNIGIAWYASMYCLRAGAPNAVLVGVDIALRPMRVSSKLRAEIIVADSRICHKRFRRPIHLLFIDGDHDYAVVKSDLDNWAAKIVRGGRVILHDCHPSKKKLKRLPRLAGVNRAVNDWFDKTRWSEIVASVSMRAFQRL